MRQIAIIQARFASTRLPGKTLLTLGPHSVLAEVITRARTIPGIDAVACAVSDGFGQDLLAAEAEMAGATVIIGSDTDVLARYARAAEATAADVILRITSDCPLIDPDLCAAVLARRAADDVDYCANSRPATFPHGLDVEAITRAALDRAASQATADHDREHVSPFITREPGFRRSAMRADDPGFARQRWTLDYPQDYAFLYTLFRRLNGTRPPWQQVAASVAKDPALLALNASRIDPARFAV